MTETTIEMVTPEVGERVYSRCRDGWWRWGVVTKKYWKKNEVLYYSVLYDDGYFVEEFEAANGIATLAQYNAGPNVSPGDVTGMTPQNIHDDNQTTIAAAATDTSADLMTIVKEEDQMFEYGMANKVSEVSVANLNSRIEANASITEAPREASKTASRATLPLRKRKLDKAMEEESPNRVLPAGKGLDTGQMMTGEGGRSSNSDTPPTPTAVANENLVAISLLEACENEYFTRDPAATKFPRLVLDEDKQLVSDYNYFSFKQMRYCQQSRKIQKRMHGLECIHCAGVPGFAKKFFSSTAHSLVCNAGNIVGHVLNCKWCPQQTKQALLQLRRCNQEQSARLSRGSKKAFFYRMWRRMGDNDPAVTSADGVPARAAPSVVASTRSKSPTVHAAAAESPRERHASSPPDAVVKTATDNNRSTAGNITACTTSSVGSKDYGSTCTGEDFLLLFLQRQESCLKVPPAKFHEFLISQDITTVVDLADSFEDEDYHNKLQFNGLKGFKFGRFLTAAKKAANPEFGSGK